MESAMAASVLTSVLALTDENRLRNSSELGPGSLDSVFQVILLNVEQCLKKETSGELADEEDLFEIILSGSTVCVDGYPSFKMKLKALIQHIMGYRVVTDVHSVTTNPSLQQLLIMVLKA